MKPARPGQPGDAMRPRRVARPSRDDGPRPAASDASEILYGFHAVLEALESGLRTIDRILVVRDGAAGLGQVVRAARERGVPVSHLPRDVFERKVGRRAVHQGVAAAVSAVPYAAADELVRGAASRGDALLLVLDGIEDPRNLGAALRSAAAAGADGVLLGVEGTVGLTAAAAKTSAGAVERIPVAREARLRERILALRRGGFRVLALDPRGTVAWDAVDMTGPIAVVAGGEGTGVRRGLLEVCDLRVAIPLARGVESLNVAVAVAVVLFEVARQRRLAGREGLGIRKSMPSP